MRTTTVHWIDILTAHRALDLARENAKFVLFLLVLVALFFFLFSPQKATVERIEEYEK